MLTATSKKKSIPVVEPVKESADILRQWYEKKYPGIKPKYLFQATGNRVKSLDDKPISYDYLLRKIKEAAFAADIEVNVGTHTMRKTFGYHHYKNTGDLTLLQRIYQHSTQAETLAYIGVTKQTVDNIYAQVDFRRGVYFA